MNTNLFLKMIFDIGRPLIMAHRGDSGNTPENTMIALENAVEIGVDVLESDIHLTKDDEIVLFHDEDLKRTTGKEGTIRCPTLNELMEIDLGVNFTLDNGDTYPFTDNGHKIVTLREAFERFSSQSIGGQRRKCLCRWSLCNCRRG